MSFIQLLRQRIKRMHPFAKRVLILSGALTASLYISSLACFFLAPHAPDYFRAIAMHRGTLEAAPATMAAGVCAAIISDIAFASRGDGSKDE